MWIFSLRRALVGWVIIFLDSEQLIVTRACSGSVILLALCAFVEARDLNHKMRFSGDCLTSSRDPSIVPEKKLLPYYATIFSLSLITLSHYKRAAQGGSHFIVCV